ncbi:DUF1993 domain-containing protein [Labilithrix luteola]|nr:DUF1993 domain-containing protein [Labilithrix luteola]
MTLYETIQQFSKMLKNLDKWLDKGVAHATAKSFDPNVLLDSRLAPDQFPLVRQVQSACDAAKFAAAYASGKTAPAHPDTERTMDEIRARIQACLAFVDSVTEAELAGGEDRKFTPGWLKGKWVRGGDFVNQISIPNFYFHVTTAYAILRHNGVEVGKMDFLGAVPIQEG